MNVNICLLIVIKLNPFPNRFQFQGHLLKLILRNTDKKEILIILKHGAKRNIFAKQSGTQFSNE